MNSRRMPTLLGTHNGNSALKRLSEPLLATRRRRSKINSIATPLIIRISITCCRTCLLLKGIISFHYHYKAASMPISVRKQDIKETYKPVK